MIDINKANYTKVVIIGAGPIGLAMASRLHHHDIPFIIIEKGDSPGANMMDWGHVPLFTSWPESVDAFSIEILKKHGLGMELPIEYPTGSSFTKDYLFRITELFSAEQLLLKTEVVSIKHKNKEFTISYHQGGQELNIRCDQVIDASGTWATPKSIISYGATELDDLIYSGIPDQGFISSLKDGDNIAVIGNGHSAMNSILALAEQPSLQINWIIRGVQPKFGLSQVGGRSALLESQVQEFIKNERVQLTPSFNIETINVDNSSLTLKSKDGKSFSNINYLISNIGAKPDYKLINNFDVALDARYQCPIHLADKANPSVNSCDTVSYQLSDTYVTDINYFVVGSKSFGSASNFLLSKGYKILDQLLLKILRE